MRPIAKTGGKAWCQQVGHRNHRQFVLESKNGKRQAGTDQRTVDDNSSFGEAKHVKNRLYQRSSTEVGLPILDYIEQSRPGDAEDEHPKSE